MAFLHSHPATAGAGILHRCQLIFAHVLGICLRSAAKVALGRISTGVTQMSRCVGNRPTVSTSISPYLASFRRLQSYSYKVLPLQQSFLSNKYESINVNPKHFTFCIANFSFINENITTENDTALAFKQN